MAIDVKDEGGQNIFVWLKTPVNRQVWRRRNAFEGKIDYFIQSV